nr:Holliday junction resolvase RuvX [uncultured Agathobaculum sp.]
MRVLGIDYGDARTGLSVSDPSGLLAGSPEVIHEWNYDKLVDRLVSLIGTYKIEEIVLGWPKNMDGTIGARAQKCEALANTLEARTGLPVTLWDERRTTVAAHDILRQAGKKTKKHRQTVDAVAAALILQGYLDFKHKNGQAKQGR